MECIVDLLSFDGNAKRFCTASPIGQSLPCSITLPYL